MELFKAKPSKDLLHQIGVVTVRINNEINMGKVYINGKEYQASSVNGKEYEVDTPIEILRIEGYRLYVRKAKEI